MKKIFIIISSIVVGFICEILLSEFCGRWFKPNLLLILVVFFNLSRGIRYGLFAAFIAGFLKDSFTSGIFGIHIFSFLLSSYLLTFIKIYIYQAGSSASRILLVFLVDILYVSIQYVVRTIFIPINFIQVFHHILIPELISTVIVSPYIFRKCKACASKFFA